MEQKIYQCRLDGKQSVTIPIRLTEGGELYTPETKVYVTGIISFLEDGENVDNIIYESVLPVLFETSEFIIGGGLGSVTLLPRSEDYFENEELLSLRLPDSETISGEIGGAPPVISISSGNTRVPYLAKIKIQVNDENIKGETLSGSQNIIDNSFNIVKEESQTDPLVYFYSDLEWLPVINKYSSNNTFDNQRILDLIENIENKVPLGISPLYDAIVDASENVLSKDLTGKDKLIYLFTDNEATVSKNSIEETISSVNFLEGNKETPILAMNLSLLETISQSVNVNRSDLSSLNKLAYFTGGQSFTITSMQQVDETISSLYGMAVGSIGYGEFSFVVDLGKEVNVKEIYPIFEEMSGDEILEGINLGWALQFSSDNITYTQPLNSTFSLNETFYNVDEIKTRYIKFFIYIAVDTRDKSEVNIPVVTGFSINYDEYVEMFLYLDADKTENPPYHFVATVDILDGAENAEILLGVANSNSEQWDDYFSESQRLINNDGKISIPIRFSEIYKTEGLLKIDNFVLQSNYGGWDPSAIFYIKDKNENIIDPKYYSTIPSDGLVIFNYMLPIDYEKGDYRLFILDNDIFKIGLKITNKSSEEYIKIKGLAYLYSTEKDLPLGLDYVPPRASSVKIDPVKPKKYEKISLSYLFESDGNNTEDVLKREIKWYINNVHVSKLDNLLEWNDLSNSNDIIYRQALSFSFEDFDGDVSSIREQAMLLGESFISGNDVIYCEIKVNDGISNSKWFKSNKIIVQPLIPTVSNVEILGEDPTGELRQELQTNYIFVASFDFIAEDSSKNDSEIIWYVNGNELKRGRIDIDEDIKYVRPGDSNENNGEIVHRMGNTIAISVVPRSEGRVGTNVRSQTYSIVNTPPRIDSVSYSPQNPEEGDRLTFTWVYFDYDELILEGSQQDATDFNLYRKQSIEQDYELVLDNQTLEHLTFSREENRLLIDGDVVFSGQFWYLELIPQDATNLGIEGEESSVIEQGKRVYSDVVEIQ